MPAVSDGARARPGRPDPRLPARWVSRTGHRRAGSRPPMPAGRSLSLVPYVRAGAKGRAPRIVAALGPSAADAVGDRVTMSSEMTDIFQEVDEEVRRDKAAEFWKKYQNLILAAAVLDRARLRPASATGSTRRKRPSRRPATSSRRRSRPSRPASSTRPTGRWPSSRPRRRGGYRILAEMTEAGGQGFVRPGGGDRRLRRHRRRRFGRSALPRRGEAARGVRCGSISRTRSRRAQRR